MREILERYVECSECGHALERHSLNGCDYQDEGCGCSISWSVRAIREERRASGLPVVFKRWEF